MFPGLEPSRSTSFETTSAALYWVREGELLAVQDTKESQWNYSLNWLLTPPPGFSPAHTPWEAGGAPVAETAQASVAPLRLIFTLLLTGSCHSVSHLY